MPKLNELADALNVIAEALSNVNIAIGGLPDHLEKIKAEIIAAMGNTEIPEAAKTALDRLSTLATSLKDASDKANEVTQALDDLNPDEPAAPPPNP